MPGEENGMDEIFKLQYEFLHPTTEDVNALFRDVSAAGLIMSDLNPDQVKELAYMLTYTAPELGMLMHTELSYYIDMGTLK